MLQIHSGRNAQKPPQGDQRNELLPANPVITEGFAASSLQLSDKYVLVSYIFLFLEVQSLCIMYKNALMRRVSVVPLLFLSCRESMDD